MISKAELTMHALECSCSGYLMMRGMHTLVRTIVIEEHSYQANRIRLTYSNFSDAGCLRTKDTQIELLQYGVTAAPSLYAQ